LEEDEKEKAAAAAGSRRNRRKMQEVEGTASACKTAPSVCGGMQIWVKALTGKT
jgi:hypothetical protein